MPTSVQVAKLLGSMPEQYLADACDWIVIHTNQISFVFEVGPIVFVTLFQGMAQGDTLKKIHLKCPFIHKNIFL